MKWVYISLAIIVLLVLIVMVIGYLLPVKHRASIELTLDAKPEQVWQRLTDLASYPRWRKSVKSVEVQSGDHWIETNAENERIAYRIVESRPMSKLVTKIDEKGLPFGGSWVFDLRPSAGKTMVTITENGEVYNPFFRFVSKFIFGHTATLREYGDNLREALTMSNPQP